MAATINRFRLLAQLQAVICRKIHRQTFSRLHNLHHDLVSTRNFIRHVTYAVHHSSFNTRYQPVNGVAAFHVCSRVTTKESSEDGKSGEEQTKKEKFSSSSRIILLDSEGSSMGQMKKSEAMLLAKGNDQLLVEVNATTFKLVNQKKAASSKKGQSGSKSLTKPKQLIIKSKITEHDLDVKLKHVINWLEKEHEVFIIINNTDPSQPQKMSLLLEAITNTCKELAVVKQAERTEELMRVILKPKTDPKGNKPPDILKFSDMKKTNLK